MREKCNLVTTAKGPCGRKARRHWLVGKKGDKSFVAKIVEFCKNDLMWFVFLLNVYISDLV